MSTIPMVETFDFLDSQLNTPTKQVSKNLTEYSTAQIANLLQKNKHYNLNHIQIAAALSAPPHLSELTQEYIRSLNRAILFFDYEENPKELIKSDEIKLKVQYTHRDPVISTIGLLKIEAQQLEKHIHYLREKDALYNSMFYTVPASKYFQLDIFDFLEGKYSQDGFYRSPLVDSLIHHKVPSSIVYASH